MCMTIAARLLSCCMLLPNEGWCLLPCCLLGSSSHALARSFKGCRELDVVKYWPYFPYDSVPRLDMYFIDTVAGGWGS